MPIPFYDECIFFEAAIILHDRMFSNCKRYSHCMIKSLVISSASHIAWPNVFRVRATVTLYEQCLCVVVVVAVVVAVALVCVWGRGRSACPSVSRSNQAVPSRSRRKGRDRYGRRRGGRVQGGSGSGPRVGLLQAWPLQQVLLRSQEVETQEFWSLLVYTRAWLYIVPVCAIWLFCVRARPPLRTASGALRGDGWHQCVAYSRALRRFEGCELRPVAGDLQTTPTWAKTHSGEVGRCLVNCSIRTLPEAPRTHTNVGMRATTQSNEDVTFRGIYVVVRAVEICSLMWVSWQVLVKPCWKTPQFRKCLVGFLPSVLATCGALF